MIYSALSITTDLSMLTEDGRNKEAANEITRNNKITSRIRFK